MSRPRRNRSSQAIRSLVQENQLLASDLSAPFFILPGINRKEPLLSLPGVYAFSVDALLPELEKLISFGLLSILLFPIVPKELKDRCGTEALNAAGIIPNAIEIIRSEFPDLCLISDIALDPYTSHGHDGVIDAIGRVLNDETVAILEQMAIIHATAGANYVAPSDMMDGRVGSIRRSLDLHLLHETGIIAYTAKYASSLYGPFRDTLSSHLEIGDKKSYQMNPANIREALRELSLDIAEGADAIMVKPALFYLDVIAKLRENTTLPLCAYHVSGEYGMVMAAEERGMLNGDKVFMEALLSIKRAGADFIFTYAAPRILPLLREYQSRSGLSCLSSSS